MRKLARHALLPALAALAASALPHSASAYVFGDPITAAGGALTFDANVRVRVEARDNTFDFNDATETVNDDTFTLSRLRLGAKYTLTPKVSLYGQVQDVREWDSQRMDVPYANAAEGDDAADLRQLYVDVGDARDDTLTLRLGRQMLAYGDERLVGGFEWNNLARTFDAAKVVINLPEERSTVDVFAGSVVQSATRNQGDEADLKFNTSDIHDIFAGVYLQNNGSLPNQKTDLYLLYRGKTRNGPFYRPNTATSGTSGVAPWDIPEKIWTLGFRAQSISSARLKGFDYLVEGALQGGKARPGLTNAVTTVPDWYDHSAYALHAEVGYTFEKSPFLPRLSVEHNVASGDTNATDTRSEAFLNLFHTNHKFYGFMDALGWKNMSNQAVTLRLKPFAKVPHSVRKSVLRFDYHWMSLKTNQDLWYRANAITSVAAPAVSVRSSLPRTLGREFDVTWTWSPSPPYEFLLGFSHFESGAYLPAVRASGSTPGRADNARFLYAQTVIKF